MQAVDPFAHDPPFFLKKFDRNAKIPHANPNATVPHSILKIIQIVASIYRMRATVTYIVPLQQTVG